MKKSAETLNIKEMTDKHLQHNDLNTVKTTRFLLRLGFQVHLSGFCYVRDAILLRIDNPVFKITAKMIYEEISEKYDVSPACVERAIRYSVDTAWNREKEIWKIKFHNTKYQPTSMEFIALAAEILFYDLEKHDSFSNAILSV